MAKNLKITAGFPAFVAGNPFIGKDVEAKETRGLKRVVRSSLSFLSIWSRGLFKKGEIRDIFLSHFGAGMPFALWPCTWDSGSNEKAVRDGMTRLLIMAGNKDSLFT